MIVVILKSGVVNNIQKVNYVQNFSLKEKKVEKQESKILLIETEDEEKLLGFISKNFPQMERINLD